MKTAGGHKGKCGENRKPGNIAGKISEESEEMKRGGREKIED